MGIRTKVKLSNSFKMYLTDRNKHLTLVKKITALLENKFTIWKLKFGIDPILGLIPGLGDIVSALMSFYIIYVAILYKISLPIIINMFLNVCIDLIIGSIPIIGDVLDFIIKPNIKNLKMLEKELIASAT